MNVLFCAGLVLQVVFCFNAFSNINYKQVNRIVVRKNNELDAKMEEYIAQRSPTIQNKQHIITDGEIYLERIPWHSVTSHLEEDWYEVAKSYNSVCVKISQKEDSLPIISQKIHLGKAQDFKKICKEISLIGKQENDKIARYFLSHFTPYLIGDGNKSNNIGLFTGYYYPTLKASTHKTERFRYAIYKKPPELKEQKYYTRKEIDNGILAGRGLELFWVEDFVDLYYLHIQGSGMLELEDGTQKHIKFAGKNGRSYNSLGKYMLQKGYVKSESEIKDFLKADEGRARKILAVNESYVFFAENPVANVVGSHGSSLVDGRSLAVDNHYIPYGSMLFVNTGQEAKVMFAQDSGSAIKGMVRGDIFIGKGHRAGEIAKRTHHQGLMYLLVHKNQQISII